MEDLNTGLIWEKKLDDPDSPRDLHKVFAWEFGNYHPSQAELDYACPEGKLSAPPSSIANGSMDNDSAA